ncbi:hypothetical protein PILCRDRAFT_817672 [Piloderma croceum F 1598]|uniref:Uncharacterized protein n=1 Tax=Piloderma croceum (strain F 1598) TaxID=765440 RepID=A0A0C3BEY1_PILCF|nr:hypothetical protein PILCRDRAFT_817672 [Piloderma croceum F 1598]
MLLVLPRLQRVFPLRQWCSRRTLSNAVPKYSSKVRALPFVTSQENALRIMNNYFNFTLLSKDASMTRMWQILRAMNNSPVKHVQAVYLPGWIVDAEVQTNAWLGDSAQQLTTVQLVDSYVPGCSFRVLSGISLNNNDIAASDAIPFSNDLITQHGSQVLCLPYTISPFSLVKKLRSQPKRIVVNDGLQFDPAINLNFLAAYPILIPLYLAQYENESVSTTVFLEAFTSTLSFISMNRVYFELCDDSLLTVISRWLKFANHVHSGYWQAHGPATPFSKVIMPSGKHSDVLHQWLDEMISQPGGAEQLVSGSPVDFADLRVREFTEEETFKNRDFLNVSCDVANMKHILKEIPDLGVKISSISKVSEDAFASATINEINRLHQKRDAMMPQWWKEASKS